MRMVDIIEKKKRGNKLSGEEISFFVRGYANGSIPDYQASALMMAIWFCGLDSEETLALTGEMANSGDRVDFSAIEGIKVDKHSTGGVADTTTLILAPLVAACGAPVVKMSGRGLGHTGGTLDKLESIPGFRVSLTVDEMIANVSRIGLAVAGQTADLAPADKAMYALRDVTATVDSMPLIASSIMSKKLASGADALVLDVKTGNGAFMREPESVGELARIMVDIGNRAGVKTRALITDMSQPLGAAVGNALEVREAIEVLKGLHAQSDLRNVALELGANMLLLAGKCGDVIRGRAMLEQAISDGSGLARLARMIAAQGGDARVVEDLSLLPQAAYTAQIRAARGGYVSQIETAEVGRAAGMLGAGRQNKQDAVDPAVGVVMNCRLGDRVETGGILCTVHYNREERFHEAEQALQNSIKIAGQKPAGVPLIYETI